MFVALRAEAETELSAGAFCDGCHRPAGGSEAGLGCLTCHAAYGNLGFGQGDLLRDLGGPIRGSAGRPAPHETVASGFLTSADLCGTCHEVEGPAGFTERPFTHWQRSPAAARGVTCQRCHMSSTPGRPGDGVQHRPVGFTRGAPDEVRALIAAALELDLVREPDGAVRVTLTSRAEGHPVPDGASFLRAIWLDLEAPEAGWRSDRRWLSARLFAGDREVVLPTRADRIEAHALDPGERRTEVFAPPLGALRACVRVQRYRPDLLEALDLDPDLAGPETAALCAESAR